ncbi:hypothetical protein [Streptomyces cavernae]|uniref:hypothetical protein n=1 Tax=Streptomyces cavernae TaxID=2259034 RepID=UPI0030B85C47
MQQGGFALQIPRPELYYRLLKAHYVKVHPRRGVKIGGLWYHAVVLDDPRFHVPSARGGTHKGARAEADPRRVEGAQPAGCQEAMDSGKETLDEDLLDEIILSLDDPDRDPQAGEIPSIPGSSTPRTPPKAARNTVLDDGGPAAADR